MLKASIKNVVVDSGIGRKPCRCIELPIDANLPIIESDSMVLGGIVVYNILQMTDPGDGVTGIGVGTGVVGVVMSEMVDMLSVDAPLASCD